MQVSFFHNIKATSLKRGSHSLLGLCLVICLCLFTPALVQAKDSAGKVLRVTGRATITSPDGQITDIKKDSRLSSTDIVSTGARSFVRMKLEDDSYIMIRPDSRMSIDDFKYDRKKPSANKGLFSLLKGGFRVITGLITDKKKYKYRTSIATIGIRGTEFSVRVCSADCYDIDPVPKDGLFLEVHDMEVTVTTNVGVYTFTQGQFAYVADSNSPAILLDTIPDVFDQSPIPPADPADCEQ